MKDQYDSLFIGKFPLLLGVFFTGLIYYFSNPQGFIDFFKPFFDPLFVVVFSALIAVTWITQYVIMNTDPLTGRVIHE